MLTCLVSREEPHVKRDIKCKIESLVSVIMGHVAKDIPTFVGADWSVSCILCLLLPGQAECFGSGGRIKDCLYVVLVVPSIGLETSPDSMSRVSANPLSDYVASNRIKRYRPLLP